MYIKLHSTLRIVKAHVIRIQLKNHEWSLMNLLFCSPLKESFESFFIFNKQFWYCDDFFHYTRNLKCCSFMWTSLYTLCNFFFQNNELKFQQLFWAIWWFVRIIWMNLKLIFCDQVISRLSFFTISKELNYHLIVLINSIFKSHCDFWTDRTLRSRIIVKIVLNWWIYS